MDRTINKQLVSKEFGVSPPNSRVLVNSVTRNGVHLEKRFGYHWYILLLMDL